MRRWLLFLLSLAIVSCAPAYVAELNSSAPLAAQMSLLGTIGPVKSPDGSSTTAIKFLPIKPTSSMTSLDQLNVGPGFLVSESGGRETLSFAFLDPGGKVQVNNIGASFSLAGADSNYPLYQYEVLTPTSTTAADVLVLKMDPAVDSTAELYRAILTGNTISKLMPPGTQLLSGLWGRPVVGAQVFPLPGADRFGFLFDNGSPLDGDGTANLNGSTAVFDTPAAGNTNIQFPGTQKRALYYNNGQASPAYRGYASCRSGGQWVCYRWDLTTILPATLLSGITHRIDALLTSGDLISTEDATLRVYDPDGAEVLSTGMGALKF